jgi:hypothetical protein
MLEVWRWRKVEGFVRLAENVEEWCFSSWETVFEGNAKADARLVGFVDATA